MLSRLGQVDEAGQQWERALELESAQEADETVARALSTSAPSRSNLGSFEAPVRSVEADALNGMGRRDEARRAATLALRAATTGEQPRHAQERLPGPVPGLSGVDEAG